LVDARATAEEFRKRGVSDENVQSLDIGLKKIGVDARDVETIIMTHLHWDHAVLASKFSHATFYVQKKEFDFANNPHPAVATQYNKSLLMNLKFELIEGDTEIIKGIKVFLTPGHSLGGQSVGVETSQGLALITGFCCTCENFFPTPEASAKGFKIVAPGIHTDMLKAYDSVLRVKQMANIIIPLHDPKFLEVDRIP
jgi:glyoxylase-like metal-dependent hydrolase (beta-lactamase superfamily II)